MQELRCALSRIFELWFGLDIVGVVMEEGHFSWGDACVESLLGGVEGFTIGRGGGFAFVGVDDREGAVGWLCAGAVTRAWEICLG